MFKGEREYICFKNFSEYEIKQNLTWRELFAIQFALQSFAPKISNKSVCWETENSAASLTVTSESNNTGSPDLLGTQSHKTSKNIQKSKHSRGTLLALSFILVFFFNLTLQKNWIVTELILRYLPTTSMFSAGEKSVFLIGSNQFKTQILACSLDFPEKNYRNRIDCFTLHKLPPY